MRVLFLAGWFPSRVHPTHGNFVEKHARVAAREHEIVVVSIQDDARLPVGSYEIDRRQKEGFPLVTVYFGQRETTSALRRLILRAEAWRKGISAARNRGFKPEIVHAHVLLDAGIIAAVHRILTRIPFVITEHSTAYWQERALPGIRGVLGRWACRKAVMILPVTTALGAAMRRKNGLAGRYQTIGNVVDTQRFHYSPPPPKPPFVFLHVSSFKEAQKNVRGLLRAFKSALEQSATPLRLHLAGDGDPDGLQSSKAYRELPPEAIETSGPHSEAEVAELMRQSHAFVLFSNAENQPVVILEALACGRPCIATTVGGLPELITAARGILVAPRAEEELTRAMLRLVDKYADYQQPDIRRQSIGICSEPAIGSAFTQLYRTAVPKRPA